MALRTRLRGPLRGLLIGIPMGVVVVLFCYSVVPTSRFSALNDHLALFELALFPMIYVNVVIHELGHVMVGWLVGMKFSRAQVWPLHLYRDLSGTRARWLRREPKRAYALMLPPDLDGLTWRYGVFCAGGVAANMLAFAVSLTMLRLNPSWLDAATMAPILLAIFVGSTIVGIAPIVPGYADGGKTQPSDGKRLLKLLKAGPRRPSLAAMWAIATYIASGFRPRDVPTSFIVAALEHYGTSDTAEGVFTNLSAFYWALDSGNVQEAGAHIDTLAQLRPISTAASSIIRVDHAFYTARYRHDPAMAAALLSDTQRELCPAVLVLRAEAAINLETRQYQHAIEATDRALLLLDAMRVPQSVEDERDWLRQIRDEATAALTASHARAAAV